MHFAVVATLVLAALIVILGLAVIVRPQIFSGLAQYFVRPWGVWVAAGIRVFAAVVLWFAAPASRFPHLFQVFAGIALITAIAVLIIGHRRISVLIEWAMSRPSWVIRVFGVLAMAIGGFVVWCLLI